VLATTGAFRAWRFAYQRLSTFSSTVTREQVKAKLREATRRGLVSMGEDDVLIATAEQERLIAKAGQDVAEQFAKSDDVES